MSTAVWALPKPVGGGEVTGGEVTDGEVTDGEVGGVVEALGGELDELVPVAAGAAVDPVDPIEEVDAPELVGV